MNIAPKLLSWYDHNGRGHLPWREKITPYRVWLSEIMLQQTQVTTVLPYFNAFIERFPDVFELARASDDEVMHYWSGLGYYARARNLHRTAQIIADDYQGRFPDNIQELQKLPGIGKSTAGAILAIAFSQPQPILDGNVKRILARLYAVEGWPDQSRVANRLWQLAEINTPHERPGDYTQAIMDLGSSVCLKRQPLCHECPLQDDCEAYKQQLTERIPEPRPKKTLPVKYRQFLLVQNNNNELLLEKLPPTGVWGGLWCFPYCDQNQNIEHFLFQQYGLKVMESYQLNSLTHTFSHYKLHCQPYLVKVKHTGDSIADNEAIIWYDPVKNQQLGLPKLIQKLTKQLR